MLNGKAAVILITAGLIKNSINELIFSKTEIFRSKCDSWIRFV